MITSAVALGEGGIAVLASGHQKVSVFDAGGALRFSLGGVGSGPGEFRRPLRLGLDGDSIWVFDLGQYRLTKFDLKSRRSSTERWPVNAVEGKGGLTVSNLTAVGVRSSGAGISMGVAMDPTSGGVSAWFVMHDADGKITAKILRRPAGSFCRSTVPRNRTISRPFCPGFVSAFSPRGSRFLLASPLRGGGTSGYSLKMVGVDGSDIYDLIVDPSPIRVPLGMIDSIANARAKRYGYTADERSEFRKTLRQDAFYPSIGEAIVGLDGETWLGPTYRVVGPWYLVRPDGELVAEVSLPGTERVIAAGGGRVWTNHEDSDGFAQPTSYKVKVSH